MREVTGTRRTMARFIRSRVRSGCVGEQGGGEVVERYLESVGAQICNRKDVSRNERTANGYMASSRNGGVGLVTWLITESLMLYGMDSYIPVQQRGADHAARYICVPSSRPTKWQAVQWDGSLYRVHSCFSAICKPNVCKMIRHGKG